MRELRWIGSSQRDLADFPPDARDEAAFALGEAQAGGKAGNAKPLKGFGGASVLEVVCDDHGDTYRAVYTVRFADAVYVLHAFQKKSTRGRKTPQRDMETIRNRLKTAEQDYRERTRG